MKVDDAIEALQLLLTKAYARITELETELYEIKSAAAGGDTEL